MDFTFLIREPIGFTINVNSMYVEAGIISKGKETWQDVRSDYFET